MSGLLNKLVTNGSVQEVATIPGMTYSSVNIRVANPLNVDKPVTIWATIQNSPSVVDLIEPGFILEANGGRFEQSCMIMTAGEKIFVQADAGLVVRVETVDE